MTEKNTYCNKCLKICDYNIFVNNNLCTECFEVSDFKKKCKDCNIEKHLKEFYKNLICKDGRFNSCRDCIKNKKRKGNVKILVGNNFCDEFFSKNLLLCNVRGIR